MSLRSDYREELYQWIWEKLEFDTSALQTADGERVRIIDNGTPNSGSGPDFSAAQIEIGGRRWFGSVEIHKTAEEWVEHGHQLDPAYNRVILHVVVNESNHRFVRREDGTQLPTLFLKPYLNQKVYGLLRKMGRSTLACGGKTALIHQKAFELQVKMAHSEYLEYKIEELLKGYDPSLKMSEAWRSALIRQVYRSLGTPSNLGPMEKLAIQLLAKQTGVSNLELFLKLTDEEAFAKKPLDWVKSGIRPANRPEKRVRQAACIHWHLTSKPLEYFYKQEPGESWRGLLDSISGKDLPGSQSLGILWSTVYLPALYLLARLLHYGKLGERVRLAWENDSSTLPDAVVKPFQKAGYQLGTDVRRMGLAHQYKRYCRRQQCHRCEVFKSVIHS